MARYVRDMDEAIRWFHRIQEFEIAKAENRSVRANRWCEERGLNKNSFRYWRRKFINDGVRPFVTGRKAWLFCDTESGAETSAMLYSIAETAKANRLKPYEYMKYILTEMAAARIDRSTIDEEKIKQILPRLLPWSDAIPDICRMKEK